MEPTSVCAVVVTYFPDWERLDQVLESLAGQVAAVVMVDNSADPVVAQRLQALAESGRVTELVLSTSNSGVGAAQNLGIEVAQRRDSSHVLLMDQDSVASSTMVERLLAAASALESEGRRVAAVGPSTAGEVAPGSHPREVPMIIASGSLIPTAVLRAVGGMDADLFIDQVDTEWCLRARSRGYAAFVTDAVLDHQLGDATTTLWVGRVRRVSSHSPERHYFNVRNSIALYRRPYIGRAYTLRDSTRLMKLFVHAAAVERPRRSHVRLMLQGVRDGWRGTTGNPFVDDPTSNG
jgi:rhamnosyltransferase